MNKRPAIRWAGALALLVCSLAFAQARDLAAELQAMAETERAFARAAGQKGWQRAFYDFFAEDGVSFQPGPVNYRENYRKDPPPPDPLKVVLDWEPLTGDIAQSADFGWLTGPYAVLDKTGQNRPPRWGFYSSVWKKQPDGQWRVLADLGIQIPSQGDALPHEPFVRVASEPSGMPPQGAQAEGLREAEQAFAAAAGKGLADAYARWMSPHARLHRNGHAPFTALAPIREYLATQPPSGAWQTLHAETSAAKDMGFTYGSYDLMKEDAVAEKGYYMRVWKRNPQGEWRLVFEVTGPLPSVTN